MLPFRPPLAPMLGLLADALPEGEGWAYEPKWDGFRVLVFRDGDEVDLRSRDDRPLLRYFPELAQPLRDALPEVAVADGEIVIVSGGTLDFEALQLRLHPAASRVNKLAAEMPAGVILWDLLADGDEDLRARPYEARRERLPRRCARTTTCGSPATRDRAVADDWFQRFEGAGLDGVMAKRLGDPYQPGKRGFVKVKHVRTIDCAVVGFRWHKHAKGEEVGSLVLALFDGEGRLHPIGVASSFSKAERKRLVERLGPLRDAAAHPWARFGDEEARPDLKSRWNADKDLAWEPIRLGPVVEVSTTQHSDRRLRTRPRWSGGGTTRSRRTAGSSSCRWCPRRSSRGCSRSVAHACRLAAGTAACTRLSSGRRPAGPVEGPASRRPARGALPPLRRVVRVRRVLRRPLPLRHRLEVDPDPAFTSGTGRASCRRGRAAARASRPPPASGPSTARARPSPPARPRTRPP